MQSNSAEGGSNLVDLGPHLIDQAGQRFGPAPSSPQPPKDPVFQFNGDHGGPVIEGFDVQDEQLFAGESPESLRDG